MSYPGIYEPDFAPLKIEKSNGTLWYESTTVISLQRQIKSLILNVRLWCDTQTLTAWTCFIKWPSRKQTVISIYFTLKPLWWCYMVQIRVSFVVSPWQKSLGSVSLTTSLHTSPLSTDWPGLSVCDVKVFVEEKYFLKAATWRPLDTSVIPPY